MDAGFRRLVDGHLGGIEPLDLGGRVGRARHLPGGEQTQPPGTDRDHLLRSSSSTVLPSRTTLTAGRRSGVMSFSRTVSVSPPPTAGGGGDTARRGGSSGPFHHTTPPTAASTTRTRLVL